MTEPREPASVPPSIVERLSKSPKHSPEWSSLDESSIDEGDTPPPKLSLEAPPRRSNVFHPALRGVAAKLSLEGPHLPETTGGPHKEAGTSAGVFASLAFGAIGVVYGDIGTSPLYTLSSVLTEGMDGPPSEEDVIGGVSMVLWALLWIVSFKYICFVLMAGNGGEGGTFALCSLLTSRRSLLSPRMKTVVSVVSMIGASFVIGDGAITPAISVTSAVGGLKLAGLTNEDAIVVISIAIIFLLFVSQRWGTSALSMAFSPVLTLWFASIATIGIYNIASYAPRIFVAFNPAQGVMFMVRYGTQSFFRLSVIFLSLTGAEAMFADMGHFRANPIRVSWFVVVFPAIALCYLGQGAYLIMNPSGVEDPFFHSVPLAVFWPIQILSLFATIIASQALISGAFSLISQAVELGFWPPGVTIKHTSIEHIGQIYIPELNFVLMTLSIFIVAVFRNSNNISQMYGVTISADFMVTCTLYALVVRNVFHKGYIAAIAFMVTFGSVDAFFFASNLTKIPTGGYVAVIFSTIFACFMLTWTFGQRMLHDAVNKSSQISWKQFRKAVSGKPSPWLGASDRDWLIQREERHEALDKHAEVSLPAVESTNELEEAITSAVAAVVVDPQSTKLHTIPGLGIFVCRSTVGVPPIVQTVSELVHALPSVRVFLHFETQKIPFMVPEERVVVKDVQDGIYRVTARYGYAEQSNTVDVLQQAWLKGLPRHQHVVFFLEKTDVHPRKGSGVLRSLFIFFYAFLKRNLDARNRFKIPSHLVMEVGVRREI
eukprot:TRINITY_DN9372_c0_g1_i2.p1 TRINITY_DN9372_c0_g1~~TRINITY_DN9372_c0_g1_i2.p1  ORF type:complete len:771 (-),score=222.28 TRINITY_DN9372_c0_g1_i2:348-2660(-)